MRKIRIKTSLTTLIEKNKKELLSNAKALSDIDKKVEIKILSQIKQ